MSKLLEATLEFQKHGSLWSDVEGYTAQMVRRALPKLADAIARLGEGKRQLNRARQHVITCLTGFELMFAERGMRLEDFHEACRRLDQIYAALEAMAELPVAAWSQVKLVPLQPPSRHPEDHPRIKELLQTRWRVDAQAKEWLEPEKPKRREEPEEAPPPRGRPRLRLLN